MHDGSLISVATLVLHQKGKRDKSNHRGSLYDDAHMSPPRNGTWVIGDIAQLKAKS